MGEQHAIVACMTKHEKQQNCAKAAPLFMIQQGITKVLADIMQAWILNEFASPPAVRQLPDGTLNLHDIDFYIWMKKILPKEDMAVFKQAFRHLFMVPDWFNTLTNAKFHKDSSVNGCMHLNAPKNCPLLKHGIKQSELACWLREKAGLTAELAKQVIEPFAEQHVENSRNRTTWNEASRRAHEKHKLRSATTAKVVAPHPEQVPTLLKQLMDKSIPEDNAIIVNEPASTAAESSTRPLTPVKHTAVLLYDDKDDIEFST